ncbi:NAD+ synthase [Rhodobacteraceae bacterium XHP0102]|nr:NAD+ synthase [Rhodobacteraceae bacterium XHP0102]
MASRFVLSIAQMNPTVGDLAGNMEKALRLWHAGRDAGADLVVLPEMALTGYQLQDLVTRPAFLDAVEGVLADLTQSITDGPAFGIGLPLRAAGGGVNNAYVILKDGAQIARVNKHHLPNDSVFDEKRYFVSGAPSGPVRIGDLRLGIPICEDAWHEDVTETMAEAGAEVLLVPNGSPYHRGKMGLRQNHMVARVIETGLPLVYLNLVGGQDDQIFDGASFALNSGGSLAAQMPAFEEGISHLTLTQDGQGWQIEKTALAAMPDQLEADYHAMVLGLRDYMAKAGFARAVLGLSGGVDSALVAAIAADAIGAENVHCVMLPSRFTSDTSLEDARAVAKMLGTKLDTLPIEGPKEAVEATLAPLFAGLAPDLTEENIQSRLRGLLLMALSNKFGEMLLTTGNKSEVAVGYATIYGDMAGGYNPIKDLYKTRVFAMCHWRNLNHRDWMQGPNGPVMPLRVIEKPPSAELRADQTDQDSLPPYEVLDAILEGLIDQELSLADLIAQGFDPAVVKRVEKLIYISEYKRFQSAPGARLTPRAFWLDRRYPIVNHWRDPSAG